jgi:hypothetical protein
MLRRRAVVLLLGIASIAVGSSGAFAQRLSPEQCLPPLDAYVARHQLQVDRATRLLAARHCAAGDLEQSIRLLRSQRPPVPTPEPESPPTTDRAACAAYLRAYIEKAGIRPTRESSELAMQRCAAGDRAGAIDALRRPGPPPSPPPTSAAACVQRVHDAARRRGIELSNADERRIQNRCRTGDVARALEILNRRR